MTCDHCVGTVRRPGGRPGRPVGGGRPGGRSGRGHRRARAESTRGRSRRRSRPPATRCPEEFSRRAPPVAPLVTLNPALPLGPGRRPLPRPRCGRKPPPPPAEAEEWNLAIGGMHCASCVARVEEALAGRAGRARGPGQPGHRAGQRRRRPGPGRREAASPRRSPARATRPGGPSSTRRGRRRVAPPRAGRAGRLLAESAVVGRGLDGPADRPGLRPDARPARSGMQAWVGWAMFALATVLQVYLGGPYLRGAWERLRQGSSNMDTLIALGTLDGLRLQPGPAARRARPPGPLLHGRRDHPDPDHPGQVPGGPLEGRRRARRSSGCSTWPRRRPGSSATVACSPATSPTSSPIPAAR